MSEFSDLPPELILHTVTFLTREIIVDPGNHVAELKTVTGTEELVPDLPSINALSRTNAFLYRILNQSLYDLCAGVPNLGKLALLFAVKYQLENAVERLVSAGVSLDTDFRLEDTDLGSGDRRWPTDMRCRSLQIVAFMGHRSMVLKVLQLSGDKVATRLYHESQHNHISTATALDYAARRGHMDIVRLLAPIPMLSSDVYNDSTPCGTDVSNGVLLPRASDRFEKHKQYLSMALVESARVGNRKISEYLVSEGADVNFVREDTMCGTSLFWAAGSNNLALVQFLLTSGADPNIHRYGRIPLFVAAHIHNVEIIQALVTAGADIHVKNYDSSTVLDLCADVKLLRFFLERGVDPNAEDSNQMTVLDRACAQKDAESAKAFVELLVQFGASPVDRTSLSAGRPTAVDIAMNRGFSEVLKILEPLVENPELLGKIAKWWEKRKKKERRKGWAPFCCSDCERLSERVKYRDD